MSENLKEKFKNAGFWTSLGASVILFIQTLSHIFGFGFDSEVANTVINSICTVLIALGIISNPNSGTFYADEKQSDTDVENV